MRPAWKPARTCPTRRFWRAACARWVRSSGSRPTDDEARTFGMSVTDWPAFDDSPAALRQLKQRFKLAVITNCDDDLFAASNRRLGVEFDWIVTAEQARGYKPRTKNFDLRLRAHRRPARAHPARRPEPLPRPCAGEGAGDDDGLDRSPPGQGRRRRDAARRRDARRDVRRPREFRERRRCVGCQAWRTTPSTRTASRASPRRCRTSAPPSRCSTSSGRWAWRAARRTSARRSWSSPSSGSPRTRSTTSSSRTR